MFVSAYATLALAAVGSVSGLVVPRKEPPKGWLANILEDYNVYHTRYLALECQNKHGQPFFDQCCHPLLKTQSLSSRPAQCRPSPSASASASAAEPTSTISTGDEGEDDDDCDDSSTSVANPTSTASTDEDDDDCDDSDDETSSAGEGKTSTTHAATSTQVVTTHAATTTQAVTTHAATTKAVTTTQKPTSTHSSATPSKSPSSSGSSSVFTDGFATFFYQGGVAGACGTVHSDNDLIAAIDEQRYGNSGLKSSLCGKQVEITNPANGKSVVVTIADDCPTCKNGDSIDLSVAAFKKIATEEEGMVKINWHFL